MSASDVIRRLQPALAEVEGITLFMQPVQDLTVEDRVSRTQFQYSLEDADADELATWVPRFVAKLQALPMLRDVASDQQNRGLQTRLEIDRDTASRLGITPQMIDDTLYDAFGQRQVSTMFTQLNQYRVVLEDRAPFRHAPQDLQDHLRQVVDRRRSAAGRLHAVGDGERPARRSIIRASFRWSPSRSTCARCLARRGGRGDRRGEERHRAADQHPGELSGHGRRRSRRR